MELKGKVVAITGAYSGLGAALSEALAKKGCRLVLGGRNEKSLEAFAEKMKGLTDAVGVKMDVRYLNDCRNLVETAVKNFGRLDIMINNAGVWDMAPIEDITEEQVKDMFETNTFGMIYCSKFAIKEMKKQGYGMVVNVSSVAGIDFKKNEGIYSASKHAAVGFTGCLAEDLKDSGIRVLCICPGGMKTGLFRNNPERMKPEFMEPSGVAGKIIWHLENQTDEWLIILRRPK